MTSMKTKSKQKTRAHELLDEMISECNTPEEIIGENGLLKQLTKALIERAMRGELTHHLGYEKHDSAGINSGNSRNGHSEKTIKGDFGEMIIEVPRDRNGTYEPKIIKKGQTRFNGFDDKIISMYARGMTTREITAHLHEIYGVEVSADLISTVTDSVIEEVREWQNRPLDPIYPILFLDAIYIKIRDGGHVKNMAAYLAIGVTMEGFKDVLGIWLKETEGAKFWLNIITELKNRGVNDVLIACVDGLKGFPEAINAVFPDTEVQLCIVHLLRNSLRFVSWKERKIVAQDLKNIYRAANEDQALQALEDFAKKWDDRYPTISKSWRENWTLITPFLAYPGDIRKAIYTTNAIESMNMSLRKVTKNRGSFPNTDAATKLLYLALRNISKKWTKPIREWGRAINQFAIIFDGRVPIG